MPWNKIKYQQAARTFIDNEYNATNTILALEPRHSRDVASVKASRMLGSVNFQEAVKRELQENGITNTDIYKTLKRNYKQNDNLAASNSAIDIVFRHTGQYAPEKKETIHAHISPSNIDKLITAQIARLEQLGPASIPTKDSDI